MSPEALSTCVGHLVREWGDYGYRVRAIHLLGWSGAGAIEVRHSDGSEFFIGCGRYGENVVHADTLTLLVAVYELAKTLAAGAK